MKATETYKRKPKVYTQRMYIRDLFMIIDDFKTNRKNSDFTPKDFITAIDMMAKTFKDEWEQTDIKNDEHIFFAFTTDANGNKSGGSVEVDGINFKLIKE